MAAIAWLFWSLLGLTTAEKSGREPAQKFIVYVQPTDSFFEKTTLVELQNFAADRSIALEKVDPNRSGCPADVTSTPAIAFENALGRSVFAGRWAEFSTVKNFFRSVKLSPQKTSTIRRDSVFLIEKGRFLMASKIKLTEPTGQPLEHFLSKKGDEKAFRKAAFRAIEKGLGAKKGLVSADLKRTDRTFYLDFHPFFAENGQFFLSAELFSQFDCHEPIFSTADQPLVGTAKTFEKTIAQAAQLLAAEAEKALRFSKIGDATTPVSLECGMQIADCGMAGAALTASVEPSADGLAKTAVVETANPQSAIANPHSWLAAGPLDRDVPACLFRFFEPLDRYAGEVAQVAGTLQLADNERVMSGNFSATLASLTTGGQSLDRYVLGKYLEATAFPMADFRFERAVLSAPFSVGATSEAKIEGLFRLKNIEKKLVVEASFTPLAADQIAVEAHFSINVADDFGLATPDGPADLKKFVAVDLHFLLRADSVATH